jgi:AcrR family transcriptional regulator
MAMRAGAKRTAPLAAAPAVTDNVGLRPRKRAKQRLDLLHAASVLFRQKGYEATRMEDIAAKAGVSTKTVYNYFPTKRELLFAFLDRDRAEMADAYEAVIEASHQDPAEALARLMIADYGGVATAQEKSLWRELMAAAVLSHDAAYDEFEGYRRPFSQCIERLIRGFQSSGKLSKRLDVALATGIVHTIHSENFRQFCAVKKLTAADKRKLARRQMEQLMKSSLPPG